MNAHYTQEQIDCANKTDLAEFLRSQGETLIKSGREYRWQKYDSLTIRGNKWYRHSRSKGGYPIDFVMEFFGKSFPEAVQMLTGERSEAKEEYTETRQNDFRLPERNQTADNAIYYLTEIRGISKSIVDTFILSGDIYEDAERHNTVFVGRDKKGVPRYAHVRGVQGSFRQDVSGSDKSYSFRYTGRDNQLFVFEAPIDLLSFICLYTQNWETRSYISLGGVSGKGLEHFLSERKDIQKIFLCLDSDDAGNEACSRLAESLPQNIAVTRLIPARKDWNEVLLKKPEISGRKYIVETVIMRKPAPAPTVSMLRMSEVELKQIDWLWEPYIPFGKVTIIQGNPGEGKTTFALRLAAACTTGTSIPKMKALEPFNVIYQTAEDGLGDTIKPRLIESGADLDRVLVINEEGKRDLTLTDRRLELAIRENKAQLLILDPIQAYLGTGVDINRANEIRPVFRYLSDMAERTGCAVVLIGHLNKASGTQSAYRGLGSIDFRAAVRSVLLIVRIRDEPNIRVICHDKSSLAPEGTSIAFSLGDENGFKWIGEYDITADDLLGGKSGSTESKKERAIELIISSLTDKSEILDTELEQLAAENGISERTLRAAKAELREQGQLCSRRVAQKWFHSLKDSVAPNKTEMPDWTDSKQRVAKTAEMLGWNMVDITDKVMQTNPITPKSVEAAE